MTKQKERVLNYTAVFDPNPEGGYTVTVPALRGCVTCGDNLKEAREMAADAIQGYCESLLIDGLSLPKDKKMLTPKHEKIRVRIKPRELLETT
jgi:antitoxin HicB